MTAFPRVLTVRILTAVVIALMFGTVVASAARAGNAQDGRRAAATAVDGSYARIAGNGFSPASGQCVLYSTLTTNVDAGTGPRQLQAGLARCNGAALGNGSCPDGQVFVERYSGSGYFCNTGYAFTNGTQYDATITRDGASSGSMSATINGASGGQGGFNLSETNQALAWGEATGGTSCPAPSSASFISWKRYAWGSGWIAVSSSAVFHQNDLAPCWATVTATQSDGGFELD